MPVSAKSLHARGLISDRQMRLAAQKGTRSEPSKMTHFENKTKGEGSLASKGHIKPSQINTQGQRTPGRFKASKGARVPEGSNLGRRQIDKGEQQRPAFPAGGKAKGKYSKPAKLHGTTSQPSLPVYDAPSRN